MHELLLDSLKYLVQSASYYARQKRVDVDEVFSRGQEKLFKKISTYEERASLATYVTRIAHNASEDVRRKEERERKGREKLTKRHTKRQETPLQIAQYRELVELVEQATQRLPEELREAWATYQNSDNYKASAQQLGIPYGTFIGRAHRARNRLRSELKRKYAA